MAVARVEGGVKTELTNREYLQDAAFGVLISSKVECEIAVERLSQAVQNPIWGVWLGRKCCIPTEPIYAGVFEDEDSAMRALVSRGRRHDRTLKFSVRGVPFAEAEENLMDVPLSFARREYTSRPIEVAPAE